MPKIVGAFYCSMRLLCIDEINILLLKYKGKYFFYKKYIFFTFFLVFNIVPTGSPPYGLRFARCFARFAPTGGSRKNLATKANPYLSAHHRQATNPRTCATIPRTRATILLPKHCTDVACNVSPR